MDCLRARRGAERDPRRRRDRCQRPRSTTDATRPPHLAPSAPHRRGPVSSVARGPRQRRRLRPFSASRTASVGALRAPNRRRPRTSARARSARRKRSSLRISRPRPALHRRGPVSSVARASAIAAAPASLSRVSRTSSVIARDHIRLVRRAAAAAGWRTHPAGAPLVRRRPRAFRAAPPPPPQNAPGSQCFRSHTTTAANAAIYDRRAPPRGRIAQTQQTCSAPPAAAAFRPRIGGDVAPIRPSGRARRAAGPIGTVCCLGLRREQAAQLAGAKAVLSAWRRTNLWRRSRNQTTQRCWRGPPRRWPRRRACAARQTLHATCWPRRPWRPWTRRRVVCWARRQRWQRLRASCRRRRAWWLPQRERRRRREAKGSLKVERAPFNCLRCGFVNAVTVEAARFTRAARRGVRRHLGAPERRRDEWPARASAAPRSRSTGPIAVAGHEPWPSASPNTTASPRGGPRWSTTSRTGTRSPRRRPSPRAEEAAEAWRKEEQRRGCGEARVRIDIDVAAGEVKVEKQA